MTALAQGSAGVALVMCFALLRTSQISAAAILLLVQSIAVAVTATVLHRPLMAISPLLLGSGLWLIRHAAPLLEQRTAPAGGSKLSIGIGAVLAILCQSQGGLALPTAIVLLSILLAATRSHPLMQVVALVAAQNGLALAGALMAQPASLPAALMPPFACLVLPLPLGVSLLLPRDLFLPRDQHQPAWNSPADTAARQNTQIEHVDFSGQRESTPDPDWSQYQAPLSNAGPRRSHAAGLLLPAFAWASNHAAWTLARSWATRLPRAAVWFGWSDLILALAMFAATLIVPLDSLASTFAPLLGLDGLLRSWVRQNRYALTPLHRGAALAQTGFTVLAACAPDLTTAWLALLAAIAMALLPGSSRLSGLSRIWGSAVLGFIGAAVALFGIQLIAVAPSLLAYFALFAGFATIAAVVPDLAVVLVILILRLANQNAWPPGVETLGIGIAVVALLACAALLISVARSHRISLLVLSQAAIALLTICTGQAEGRFAAMILLILLIMIRAAARVRQGAAATLALAGLGGVPPLGVFPGLVLVVLALSAHDMWLLLPIGAALIPIVSASMPRQLPALSFGWKMPSLAWLPLILAFLTGYFAPDRLVHWWRILTAGRT